LLILTRGVSPTSLPPNDRDDLATWQPTHHRDSCPDDHHRCIRARFRRRGPLCDREGCCGCHPAHSAGPGGMLAHLPATAAVSTCDSV